MLFAVTMDVDLPPDLDPDVRADTLVTALSQHPSDIAAAP